MFFKIIAMVKKGLLISEISEKLGLKENEIKKYIAVYNMYAKEKVEPCNAKIVGTKRYNEGIRFLKSINKGKLDRPSTREYNAKTKHILSFREHKNLMSFSDIADITGEKVAHVRWIFAREDRRDRARLGINSQSPSSQS